MTHKNHKNLIEAWIMLAKEGIYPDLYLTLGKEDSKKIHELIQHSTVKYKINIHNKGYVSFN